MRKSPSQFTVRFKTGVALLILNVPLAYGGLAITAALAAITRSEIWLLIGGAIYVFSWLMLAAGMLLAGPEGLKYVKGLRGRWLKKRAARHQE